MAYLQLEHVRDAAAGGAVGISGTGFGALERDVVRLSCRDGRSSLHAPGRLARIGMLLTGFGRRTALSDLRLEALRRYAVLYRLDGDALDEAEDVAINRAGFQDREIRQVRQLVDSQVARNRRSERSNRPTALGALVILALASLLIQRATGDLAISLMAAGLLTVTLVSLTRPARHRAASGPAPALR